MPIQEPTELDTVRHLLDDAVGEAKTSLYECVGGPFEGQKFVGSHAIKLLTPDGVPCHYRLIEVFSWSPLRTAQFWQYTGDHYELRPEHADVPEHLFKPREIHQIKSMRSL